MRVWLLLISFVFAATSMPAGAHAMKPAVDVMLVLDNSGSMKKNDPKRLLKTVVRNFTQHLEAGDRLGMVMFDESAHRLMELTPVSDAGFAPAFEAALAKLTYGGRLTDIPRGLELARYELEHARRARSAPIMVFMTDGEVDLGSSAGNAEAKRYLRETVIPDIKSLGARVFGITLTEDADVSLIQEIGQATGGSYFRLPQVADVQLPFDRISARLQGLRESPAEQERGAETVQAVQKMVAAQLQEFEAQRRQLLEQLARASEDAEQRRQEMINREASVARDAERRNEEDETPAKAAVALPEGQSQIPDGQRRSLDRVIPRQWMTVGSVMLLLLLGAVMTYSVFTVLHPLSTRKTLSAARR
jgi:Mg-chelatase subunit ChlD